MRAIPPNTRVFTHHRQNYNPWQIQGGYDLDSQASLPRTRAASYADYACVGPRRRVVCSLHCFNQKKADCTEQLSNPTNQEDLN